MFIILTIFGFVGFIFAIFSISEQNELTKNGIEVDGLILSYESDHEGYKTPIIEFETLDGEKIQKKPYFHTSSDLSKFINFNNNLNSKVKILYDPKCPEKFVIKNDEASNLLGMIFVSVVSLVIIFVGIYNLL